MFYWARGNDSVSGLDTLRLAQYTVEDHYTSAAEAVYETGTHTQNTTQIRFVWVSSGNALSFERKFSYASNLKKKL